MTIDPVAVWCEANGLMRPETEYRFAPPRKWRFDYAWPGARVALEREGGGWVRGRHHRPAGYAADCEKYNTAALLGWIVIRATPEHFQSGKVYQWIEEALAIRNAV